MDGLGIIDCESQTKISLIIYRDGLFIRLTIRFDSIHEQKPLHRSRG